MSTTTMLEMVDETSSSLIGSTGFSQASSYIELALPICKALWLAVIVELFPKRYLYLSLDLNQQSMRHEDITQINKN